MACGNHQCGAGSRGGWSRCRQSRVRSESSAIGPRLPNEQRPRQHDGRPVLRGRHDGRGMGECAGSGATAKCGVGGTLPRRWTRHERRGTAARRFPPGLFGIGAARGDVNGSRRPLYDFLRAEHWVQRSPRAAGLYARRARGHARRAALRHDGQPPTVAATTHRLGDDIFFGGVRVSGNCAADWAVRSRAALSVDLAANERWGTSREAAGAVQTGAAESTGAAVVEGRSRRPARSARVSNPSPSTRTRTPRRPSSRRPPTSRAISRDSCRPVSRWRALRPTRLRSTATTTPPTSIGAH